MTHLDRFLRALPWLFLLAAYLLTSSLDYADAQRLECVQRYPDTYFATVPDAVCQSLVP